jgi:hypothetical protein
MTQRLANTSKSRLPSCTLRQVKVATETLASGSVPITTNPNPEARFIKLPYRLSTVPFVVNTNPQVPLMHRATGGRVAGNPQERRQQVVVRKRRFSFADFRQHRKRRGRGFCATSAAGLPAPVSTRARLGRPPVKPRRCRIADDPTHRSVVVDAFQETSQPPRRVAPPRTNRGLQRRRASNGNGACDRTTMSRRAENMRPGQAFRASGENPPPKRGETHHSPWRTFPGIATLPGAIRLLPRRAGGRSGGRT